MSCGHRRDSRWHTSKEENRHGESSWQVQETAKRPAWPERTWGRGTEIWPARQPAARIAVLALTPWDGELSRVRAKDCRDVA